MGHWYVFGYPTPIDMVRSNEDLAEVRVQSMSNTILDMHGREAEQEINGIFAHQGDI